MTGIRIQNHCIFFNGGSFPSTLQAAGMLILLESFLSPGIFPLSPSFFFDHLVPHVCPSIWHIEHSRASLWNPRYFEKVTCLSVLQGLFLLLCNFYMNLNTQNSWPHWLSTYSWQFLPAITFMWSDWQIQEWPQFFQQQCCASALLSQFQWRYYFSIFCSFWILIALVIWSIVEIAVLCPSLLVSIVVSFLKASSSSQTIYYHSCTYYHTSYSWLSQPALY